MLRMLHTWPALVAGALVAFMALTGAILSFEPVLSAATATDPGSGDLATLAAGVADHIDTAQRVVRLANGDLVAYALGPDGPTATLVDAAGTPLSAYEPSAFFQFVTELHRSLLAGDTGRMLAGLAAFAMIVLSVGGILLLAKRLGGWKRLFSAAKGTASQRLHVELSRLGALVLGVVSITGVWMALSYFGLIGTSETDFSFPPESAGTGVMALADMPALASIALSDFRELVFPAAGDAYDVISVTTASGSGAIDQATGTFLSFTANGAWESLYQLVYTLHTGAGLWWYALLLGAGALSVPVLLVTGLVIWLRRRRSGVRLANTAPPQGAETVILVGSEGNTTWGFAATLHAALVDAGQRVHTAAMNDLHRHYAKATRLIILTATHGDGDAPASAGNFLARLDRFQPNPQLQTAVLGFGDRSFADFCGYARKVDTALAAKGAPPMLAFTGVDRQSAQAFADWGRALGAELGLDLDLQHVPELPKLSGFVLESRRDFGRDYQTPRAILRFRPVGRTGLATLFGGGSRFAAGDLIGIVPPGSRIPRYYSLASSSRDGFVEICVSKQPGGLCSGYLCDLQPGTEIAGFIRRNHAFHAPRGRKPLILIGAGTGIAPLVGHVRANTARRPAFLYWGGRDPNADFLFRDELYTFREDGRLSGARLAFSRTGARRYVQHELRADADFLRMSISKGAAVLVCGGTEMARGVRETLDEVLAPLKLSSDKLKASGRLAEDVY